MATLTQNEAGRGLVQIFHQWRIQDVAYLNIGGGKVYLFAVKGRGTNSVEIMDVTPLAARALGWRLTTAGALSVRGHGLNHGMHAVEELSGRLGVPLRAQRI